MDNKENMASKLENKTDLQVAISGIATEAGGSTHDVNNVIEHANACVVVCGVDKGMAVQIDGVFDAPFVVAMLSELREAFGKELFDVATSFITLAKVTEAFDAKNKKEEQNNG